jgi:SEC-C motif-containing protein
MMNTKIGRNDPCWCGSGKKHKKCHLNRAARPPAKYHELASDLLDLRQGKRKCLYPLPSGACTSKVIKAHSISRSAALSKIARSGHVYQPDSNPFQIQKHSGGIAHKLVGIGDASTFTGFCSTHDAALFRPVDEGSLIPTNEQSLLLHYRSLCRELYVKRPTIETNELLREADSGKPLPIQHFVQKVVDLRGDALRLAVRELESDKANCDKAILTQDYSGFSGCALRFGKIPTLACAGLTHPVYDFSGNTLQNLIDLDEPAFNISFTLLPADGGGVLALGWSVSGDRVCRAFVSSLLCVADARKSDAVVQLIFDSCENHVAQPDWWENLPSQLRLELEGRLLNWTDIRPIDTKALVPGSSRYADWEFQTATWL